MQQDPVHFTKRGRVCSFVFIALLLAFKSSIQYWMGNILNRIITVWTTRHYNGEVVLRNVTVTAKLSLPVAALINGK